MRYDSFRHHRHSIRMKSYDYASEGAYFVTVCTQHRERLLGDVVNGEMKLNPCGKIVVDCWKAIPDHFDCVSLDEFVVMPNHVHGIIWIVGAQFIAPQNKYDKSATPGVINHARCCYIGFHRSFLEGPFNIFNSQIESMHFGLATQLLRTHHSKRSGIGANPAIHFGQPTKLGIGSGILKKPA